MALKGALDAEFRMDKADDGVIRLQATKMKDSLEPGPLAFRLRTVELQEGVDDPPTSAVLDSVDYVPAPKASKAGRGKHQTKALDVLEQLHHQQRQPRKRTARIRRPHG